MYITNTFESKSAYYYYNLNVVFKKYIMVLISNMSNPTLVILIRRRIKFERGYFYFTNSTLLLLLS